MKLLPASDIIFMGNLYSEEMMIHATISLSADKLSVFKMPGNLV